MKAIILAGGSGTRLHPLSIRKPKPMVRLLDRPLLEHILLFLRGQGVEDICLTLCYLPEQIQNAFGDGSTLGLRLRYEVESEALGTAGGVRRCADWLGEEDFLLISGDAALSFDLQAMLRAHRETQAAATLAVWRAGEPGEYGLVLTDRENRILRFTEKPSQAQACTDRVNTGIYLLSPAVLRTVPAGKPADFAGDVFPRLLRDGGRLFAFPLEGYWCDVGNVAAYRAANRDALRGKLPLQALAPELRPGVRSASPLPKDAVVTPPVCIGENVRLEAGLRLGPDCVIGSGSVIGKGSELRETVTGRIRCGEGCRISGAVLEDGVRLGRDCRVGDGAVIAEDCRLGDRCVLEPGAVLWPGKSVPAGSDVKLGLSAAESWYRPVFDEAARLTGDGAAELTPALLRAFGAACAKEKAVGAAFTGGNLARAAAQEFLLGAASGGRDVCLLDAKSEAGAAFMAVRAALEPLLFLRQTGSRLTLRFFGADGQALPRSVQRRIEQAASAATAAEKGDAGSLLFLTGCEELYAASLARAVLPETPAEPSLRLRGRSPAALALTRGLERAGLSPKAEGVTWALSPDGFVLSAVTPSGLRLEHDKLLAALCLLELRAGGGPLTVPDEAPQALDRLAAAEKGRLLRPERDGAEALGLYWAKPWFADAGHLAARLISRLAAGGQDLEAVAGSLPAFFTARAELTEGCDRGELLERLGVSAAEAQPHGVRLRSAKGSALVTPAGARAYRISAESFREEYALELIAEVEQRLTTGEKTRKEKI